MIRIRNLLCICISILIGDMRLTRAQDARPSTTATSDETSPASDRARTRRAATSPASQPADDEKPVVTSHEITLNGRVLKYKATAGTIALKDDAGKARAKMFFVAYEKDAPADSDRADRPVTFVFNGGPGAASIWLHLGCVGPKTVVLPEDGAPPAPPYRLADNPHTWLDVTDLVLIDPVGTGYSRPEGDPAKARDFYGVKGDIDGVSDFIRIYLTDYQRWLSPKFLLGESYGTTRAAGLSEQLHDRYGIDLSGITLVSTVLNFQTLSFDAGNDVAYPLYLPTYTAAAHYHKKLAPELQGDLRKTLDHAQTWALGEYTHALIKGASLPVEQREQVARQLARFTGLPLDYVKRSNLRINPFRFEKELLADQNRLIGRMDGRFSGHDADPLNDTPEYDPTLTGYVGVFSSTMNDYVRRTLKYENEANYEFLSPRVGPWDFGTAGQGFLNVSTTLRRAMTKLPTMKILLCSGYYDLATPFAAADFTLNQMPLNDELRANLTHKYYEGGHMMYLNRAAHAEMTKDVREFYESALKK